MYAPLDKPPIDEIYHFGIKGMKWGHRPSDPDPTDASHHPVKFEMGVDFKEQDYDKLIEKYHNIAVRSINFYKKGKKVIKVLYKLYKLKKLL